jgi:hypothetical protein
VICLDLPKCEEEEEYLKVARGEDIKIACPVKSSPPPSYFRLAHLGILLQLLEVFYDSNNSFSCKTSSYM